ncbi:MAG: FtsW/RodA/SpoVE family cell cycle protein [Candidatus Dojkabacteria bacterium]
MQIFSSKQGKKFHIDLLLLLTTAVLSIIGIVNLLSAKILPAGGFGDLENVYKQVLFILIGFVFYFILSKVELSYLKYWQVLLIIYLITLLLLVATLLFAPTINNVKRWLIIGGFQLQASEIAKLTVILVTASLLSLKDKYNQWILLLLSFVLVLPLVVLVYLQPNGSISILLISIWFLISFLGLSNFFRNIILVGILLLISGSFLLSAVTGNMLWFLLLIPAIILAVFSYYAKNGWRILLISTIGIGLIIGFVSSVIWQNVLLDYQRDRIEAFINPTGTEEDIGFNVNQSRIAIGSGKIFGKGFGNGTQSKRNFLPEHETDFIFASYAEEFGLVGSVFLIFMYGVIILVCFFKSIRIADNKLLSLISLGLGIQILLQVFINIGTNLGTIPATGIPLPFMSVGGSSTIMTLLSLGLIQNIHNKIESNLDINKKEILDIYD